MKNVFCVDSAYKRYTRDNYEKGEDPSTTQESDLIDISGFYHTIEDLAEELSLPAEKDNWVAFDDGRLICFTIENYFGTEPSDTEMEQFKKGEIDLYACEYNFRIKFIEGVYTPSVKELAQKFNIEEY
jgi:hypothetical protein